MYISLDRYSRVLVMKIYRTRSLCNYASSGFSCLLEIYERNLIDSQSHL